MTSSTFSKSDRSIIAQDLSVDYPLHIVAGRGIREHVAALMKGAHRRSEHFPALRQVNFQIAHGERVAFLGKNGAGKSTLLRTIAGVIAPTSGDVLVNGEIHSLLSLGAGIDDELSGLDNIVRICRLYDLDRNRIEAVIDDVHAFSELGDALRRQVKTYSDGMRVRLLFSTYTSFEADILVMDEMLGAGDSAFLEKAKLRAMTFYESAGVILIATHSIPFALDFCTRGIVLNSGRIIFDGPIREAVLAYQNEA